MQISILGLLGLIFVTLKLIGTISWPWLWVLAPFWVGLAAVLMFWAMWGGVVLVFWLVSRKWVSASVYT